MTMILLLVFYMHSVATSPDTDSGLYRNVTIDLKEDACANPRSMNESVVTTKKLKYLEILAFDTTDLRSLKRAKRQKETAQSSKKRREREEKARIANVKQKALNLMNQAMYAAQELIWPMEPLFKRFEDHVPYRMAFVFSKLHTLMREAKSMMKLIENKRGNAYANTAKLNPSQRLQIYWQLVKRNMDATYLVDYIIQRVPLGTEGRDTTIIPPTTKSSHDNTTSNNTVDSSETNQSGAGNDSGRSGRKYRRYFREKFQMPVAGSRYDILRAGYGRLGRTRNISRYQMNRNV